MWHSQTDWHNPLRTTRAFPVHTCTLERERERKKKHHTRKTTHTGFGTLLPCAHAHWPAKDRLTRGELQVSFFFYQTLKEHRACYDHFRTAFPVVCARKLYRSRRQRVVPIREQTARDQWTDTTKTKETNESNKRDDRHLRWAESGLTHVGWYTVWTLLPFPFSHLSGGRLASVQGQPCIYKRKTPIFNLSKRSALEWCRRASGWEHRDQTPYIVLTLTQVSRETRHASVLSTARETVLTWR